MKTYNNLFPEIIRFENLFNAARNAARGKREQPNVLLFFDRLEDNLWQLQHELETQSYQPGGYSTFHIYDPKPRLISAAPFRDRVVHHALINIIEPIFETRFIFDSYANRIGKGTHAAIRRFQLFLRKYEFALKCDIRKYFPSIDHNILKTLIRRRIADANALWLIDTIIDYSNLQESVVQYFPGDDLLTPVERRQGLPIGNLTSQFFANVYLDPLDHFIKEQLGCQAYVRYVDDFVLLDNTKTILKDWWKRVADFLSLYKLKLNPNQCHIFPALTGRRFLGQVVYRTHRRLSAKNIRKLRSRMKQWNKYPPDNLIQRIASWRGHAMQADSTELLKLLFRK
ncbi:group II intron reverse transcriptase domain-containing protein [candidate division KSB1 bacterium]|nr:group II intron reverse transcriptase domain-containing protein [candidate division KSB1 bacterium]